MIREITREEFDKNFYDLNYEGYLYHYNHRKDIFVKKGINPVEPDLEQIMVYLERSKNNESFTL